MRTGTQLVNGGCRVRREGGDFFFFLICMKASHFPRSPSCFKPMKGAEILMPFFKNV